MKPIGTTQFKKLEKIAKEALRLASSHDPDHAKELKHLSDPIYAEVKLQDRRFTDTCRHLSVLESKAAK